MPTPIVELAKALKTRLDTALSVTFERAYVPFLNREDVEDGKYILMASSEDTTTRRLVDTDKASIVVAYQKALPDSTTAYPDPLKNIPFFDDCMEKVEAMKALFREGGALNLVDLYGYVYLSQSNVPLYRPDFILDYQIFTSEVRLDFIREG